MFQQVDFIKAKVPHFVICTPPYVRNSAGIVVLHELGEAIADFQYPLTFVFFDPSDSKWFLSAEASHYSPSMQGRVSTSLLEMETALRHALNHGIVIYPEIVSGNPLNAERIVRYFLNRDAAITGSWTNARPNDYIVAYSPSFHDKPDSILYKPVHDSCFNSKNTNPACQRTLNLTYFGKVASRVPAFPIPGSVLITKAWPQTSSELASLLKSSKYLYTWDHITSLMIDALYCGTEVVLMEDHPASSSRVFNSEHTDFPHHKGRWANGKISIEEADQSYESKRLKVLKACDDAIEHWPENVQSFIEDALRHFQYR